MCVRVFALMKVNPSVHRHFKLHSGAFGVHRTDPFLSPVGKKVLNRALVLLDKVLMCSHFVRVLTSLAAFASVREYTYRCVREGRGGRND